MREAARTLDDVSDHLGEVLRRADELLAEWSRFGAHVRTQVEREVAAISDVVDGAVARAANSGIDRAVVERLRALTVELERLEQRTRAASRAVVEQREADRRVLWFVIAGIVLANALLVVLVLRKPAPAPVTEPVRIEAAPAPSQPALEGAAPAGGSADPTNGSGAGSATDASGRSATPNAGSNAAAGTNPAPAGANPAAGARPATAGSNAAPAGTNANAGTSGAGAPNTGAAGATSPGQPAKTAPRGGAKPAEAAGSPRPTLSPIALPPKTSNTRPHKKLP